MKEILHSKHHSTVHPRLSARKKESLQNLHTRAEDSAIHLLGNNRVLKERPSPIADEEQRPETMMHTLTSTIRTLPSTALLQAQGFRQTSDICTDCGALPQDVRHLFAFNAHPMDFLHEDLWRNPEGSIHEFHYIEDKNIH